MKKVGTCLGWGRGRVPFNLRPASDIMGSGHMHPLCGQTEWQTNITETITFLVAIRKSTDVFKCIFVLCSVCLSVWLTVWHFI